MQTVFRFGSDEAGDPAVGELLAVLGARLGSEMVGRNDRDPELCYAIVLREEPDWWAHVDAAAEFAENHADAIRDFLGPGNGPRWSRIDVAVWPADQPGDRARSLLFPAEVLRVLAGLGIAAEVTVYPQGPSP